jgi:hypothetical protein
VAWHTKTRDRKKQSLANLRSPELHLFEIEYSTIYAQGQIDLLMLSSKIDDWGAAKEGFSEHDSTARPSVSMRFLWL